MFVSPLSRTSHCHTYAYNNVADADTPFLGHECMLESNITEIHSWTPPCLDDPSQGQDPARSLVQALVYVCLVIDLK